MLPSLTASTSTYHGWHSERVKRLHDLSKAEDTRRALFSSLMAQIDLPNSINCHDISLLRGWLVAGLPLIGTERAEHWGIRSWAGPTSMIV